MIPAARVCFAYDFALVTTLDTHFALDAHSRFYIFVRIKRTLELAWFESRFCRYLMLAPHVRDWNWNWVLGLSYRHAEDLDQD
jgi:hypothetical protein